MLADNSGPLLENAVLLQPGIEAEITEQRGHRFLERAGGFLVHEATTPGPGTTLPPRM